jgi:DNA-binding PadR family transcriptional regulator
MTRDRSFDPLEHLPLSPLAYRILLALAEGDKHGYAILKHVGASQGPRPSASTLYAVIERLEDDGWIEESSDRPEPALDDERRRYYRLTDRGRSVGQAEAERLEALVRFARRHPFNLRHV